MTCHTWFRVERSRVTVGFFHTNSRDITQKRMITKCSNSVQGMTLRYSRSDMVLGLKGQRSKLGLELVYRNSAA